MRVVVCGGGVIGCASAYYLARSGADVTLIEGDQIATGASGKSGGFLAADWCDGNEMSALAHASFALHDELAGELSAAYGYRHMDTYFVTGGALADPDAPRQYAEFALDWLDGRSQVHQVIGTQQSTAQVDPAPFTQALADAAVKLGARLLFERVEGLCVNDHSRVTGVRLATQVVDADAVLLAMGPWTDFAREWANLPKISASKGHSIVLRPKRPVPAEALFAEYANERSEQYRQHLSPEIVPRANGEVYACGLPDNAALPLQPQDVSSDETAAAVLHAICADMSNVLAEAELIRYQACYRPIVADALPVMGAIPGMAGAYVSTAHNCWGMLNAPGSGVAMTELILEDKTPSLDLSAFAPDRPTLLR